MAESKSTKLHERVVLKPFYKDLELVKPADKGEKPVKVQLNDKQLARLAEAGCVEA